MPRRSCFSQQLTPAQLQAQGLARVQVESLAKWNLNLPRGSFEVQITAIDGKSTCHGNACVVTVLVPPGPANAAGAVPAGYRRPAHPEGER